MNDFYSPKKIIKQYGNAPYPIIKPAKVIPKPNPLSNPNAEYMTPEVVVTKIKPKKPLRYNLNLKVANKTVAPVKKAIAKKTNKSIVNSQAAQDVHLNAIKATKHSRVNPISANATIGPLQLPSPTSGYTPIQLRTAYGLTSLSATGAGQTICVVDAYKYPNAVADFQAFDAFYSIGHPNNLRVVSLGTVSDVSWSLEQALDVQAIHSIAPQALIVLVQAKSDSLADLLAAVEYCNTSVPAMTVLSMSWGSDIFSGESNYNSYFTKADVVYIASSGDTGAVPS